jgi:AraC family transcriptional regulator of adaptative response / DNA-3-methyladenine glycosylase II
LRLTLSDSLRPVCVAVLSKVKTVFDLRANAALIDDHLASDPVLAPALAAHGGMRLPGAFDGFELLLRAILGQQISVKGATTLAGRMAVAFGAPIETPWPVLSHLSPDVERIAAASIDRIARIGMPGKRAETIRHVARAVVECRLNLAPGADPDVVCEQLIAVPGIGEWTASYVAMRALAWPDALPLGDLGIKKALGLSAAKDITARSERWRPWRAYAAIYMWLSLSGG